MAEQKKAAAGSAALLNSVFTGGNDLPEVVLNLPQSFRGSEVTLRMFDAVGNRVLMESFTYYENGQRHEVPVTSRYIAPGSYLVILTGEDGAGTLLREKMMLGIKY